VAYDVQTAESVEAYIHAIEGFSDQGKKVVIEGYLADLADQADHYLQQYPLAHESYKFLYEYVLIDGELIYSFRFIADGSHMAMGIVQVVYVDHETTPVPS
jgi:hypothetical protein